MSTFGEISCDYEFYGNSCEYHVTEVEAGILGSIGEFCGAFYHVPGELQKQEEGAVKETEKVCLDTAECKIGKEGRNLANPKTAVALVKFERSKGEPLLRRYTNCRTHKKHAEEFFKDAIKGLERSEISNLTKITVYITMQPCHFSVNTEGTPWNYSCCDILIGLANEELKGIPIEIKPTHISKARWNGENQELYDIALIGVKQLLEHENITISKMKPDDWDDLIRLVNEPENLKKKIIEVDNHRKRRTELDDNIDGKLTGWDGEVKQSKKKQQQR